MVCVFDWGGGGHWGREALALVWKVCFSFHCHLKIKACPHQTRQESSPLLHPPPPPPPSSSSFKYVIHVHRNWFLLITLIIHILYTICNTQNMKIHILHCSGYLKKIWNIQRSGISTWLQNFMHVLSSRPKGTCTIYTMMFFIFIFQSKACFYPDGSIYFLAHKCVTSE